jgi:hypothetical protein
MHRAIILPNKEKSQWAQILEDGVIQLYFVVVDRSTMRSNGTFTNSSSTFWYASKVGFDLIEIKTTEIWGSRKKRKEGLRAILEDDAVVLKVFDEMEEYSFENVREIILLYNQRAAKKGQSANTAAQ